jgi:hypothetical protein
VIQKTNSEELPSLFQENKKAIVIVDRLMLDILSHRHDAMLAQMLEKMKNSKIVFVTMGVSEAITLRSFLSRHESAHDICVVEDGQTIIRPGTPGRYALEVEKLMGLLTKTTNGDLNSFVGAELVMSSAYDLIVKDESRLNFLMTLTLT